MSRSQTDHIFSEPRMDWTTWAKPKFQKMEDDANELRADVRLLGEAILNLRNAKGRHNTGIAYERLLAEFADFQLKHPLQ